MLVKRKNISKLEELINSLSKRKFNIKTQYKFIKIKKAIEQEEEIYQEQLKINCEPFFERDNEDNPILSSQGGYKIKAEKMNECYLLMNQMNNLEVQIPDIYFSLDELEELNLPLESLSILEPFIK